MEEKNKKEMFDSMSKDPDNWKGIFYINSKDPRKIVPKKYPLLGWTFNFGHKIMYIGIIVIILIFIAYKIFI